MLNKLSNPQGARKAKKRVGRGQGSTLGKTSGRGHKGQKSRSGKKIRIGFEGGQMPLYRRLPKRGFTNPNRIVFQVVNLQQIVEHKRLDLTHWIDETALFEAGLIRKKNVPVKLLGTGEVKIELKLRLEHTSETVKKKIEQAGGQIESPAGASATKSTPPKS